MYAQVRPQTGSRRPLGGFSYVPPFLRDDALSPRPEREAGAGLAWASLAHVHALVVRTPALGRPPRRRPPARGGNAGATSLTETTRNDDSGIEPESGMES